jgi:hypothetical protein
MILLFIIQACNDVNAIEDILNLEMENIGKYCGENELLLNLKKGKTESMLFGTSKRISKYGRDLKIQYQNTEISFVKEYVYLGNTVDSHLLMNTNFDCAYKKASGRLRLLQNVRKYLTVDAALKIFRMIILPILTYSSTVKLNDHHRDTKGKVNFASKTRAKSIIRSEDVPNIS